MTRYTSFDPNVEIIGRNVLGFIKSANRDNILPILEKHDLAEIDPEKWYPLQNFLDVLSDLSEQGDAMFDFVSIGIKNAETVVFPPEFEGLSFDETLALTSEMSKTLHRNGDAGYITVEKVSEKRVKYTLKMPYPDDYVYGELYGMARRFLPPGTHFVMTYDDDIPRREHGGEVTIIHLTWE